MKTPINVECNGKKVPAMLIHNSDIHRHEANQESSPIMDDLLNEHEWQIPRWENESYRK